MALASSLLALAAAAAVAVDAAPVRRPAAVCDGSYPYRTPDGSCNNLDVRGGGTPPAPFNIFRLG